MEATKVKNCAHQYYNMIAGELSCSECGAPPPPRVKAVEQSKTENKAFNWPPESKRQKRTTSKPPRRK